VSSFGLGGSNAHVIIESAASFNAARKSEPEIPKTASNVPHLLLFSANTPASIKAMVEQYRSFLGKTPICCQMWPILLRISVSICLIAPLLSARVTNSPFRRMLSHPPLRRMETPSRRLLW
jgi:hypothetical protein